MRTVMCGPVQTPAVVRRSTSNLPVLVQWAGEDEDTVEGNFFNFELINVYLHTLSTFCKYASLVLMYSMVVHKSSSKPKYLVGSLHYKRLR
jgi:hypothetical protein